MKITEGRRRRIEAAALILEFENRVKTRKRKEKLNRETPNNV